MNKENLKLRIQQLWVSVTRLLVFPTILEDKVKPQRVSLSDWTEV